MTPWPAEAAMTCSPSALALGMISLQTSTPTRTAVKILSIFVVLESLPRASRDPLVSPVLLTRLSASTAGRFAWLGWQRTQLMSRISSWLLDHPPELLAGLA